MYRTGDIMVDPAMARDLLQWNDENRRVRPDRVSQYAGVMRAGEWSYLSDPGLTLVGLPDGGYRLLNGQHRLRAVIESGAAVLFRLKVASLTEEEAREEYAKIDQGAGRNVADVLRDVNAPAKDVQTVVSALAGCEVLAEDPYHFHQGMRDLTMARKAAIMRAYPDDARFAFTLRADSRRVIGTITTGMTLAAIQMYRTAPVAAVEFWRQVVTGEMLAEGEATYALRAMLTKQHHRVGGSGTTRVLTERVQALTAWRAYCRGDRISKIQVTASGTGLATFPVATPKRK